MDLYKQNQDLIQVGAYEQGSNPDLDQAIILRDKMETLLQQNMMNNSLFLNVQNYWLKSSSYSYAERLKTCLEHPLC